MTLIKSILNDYFGYKIQNKERLVYLSIKYYFYLEQNNLIAKS